MINNTKVGNQIAFLRKEKGLTGEKFAERLGVSPQAVSKWENGKCLPETALLPALSALLGVSIDAILTPPQTVIRKFKQNDAEFYLYNFVRSHINCIPQIYRLDEDTRTIVMEDVSETYVSGRHYDEENDDGAWIRGHIYDILQTAADWHSTFWEDDIAFESIHLDWRHLTQENFAAHISMMEKDFNKFKKNADAGKIPQVWEGVFAGEPFRIVNNIDTQKLVYFTDAIARMKTEYTKSIGSRFRSGKNITVIHGDMNPNAALVSKSADGHVKFQGLQAVRMGLPTEDLAMLLALHIAPRKKDAIPLLDSYYRYLCKSVKRYAYESFLEDYKFAVMENMFFIVRLINRKIYDFEMLAKAMEAFETFVLEE